jgi:hypothetical protein
LENSARSRRAALILFYWVEEIRSMTGERRVMQEALFDGFSLERHVAAVLDFVGINCMLVTKSWQPVRRLRTANIGEAPKSPGQESTDASRDEDLAGHHHYVGKLF